MTTLSRKSYIKLFLVFVSLFCLSEQIPAAEFEWKGQKYKSGLKYKFYHGDWTSLPDFSTLKPKKNGNVDNFKLDIKEVNYREDHFALFFEGFIRLPKGEYTFYLSSDDGSKLFLNGKELIDHDGVYGPNEKSATIKLERGVYPIKVLYFEAAGNHILKVQCEGPSFEKQDIPVKALFHIPKKSKVN